MAQAFTTFFSFEGKTFTAVISQRDGVIHIYIPDESLHHLLPDGKADYPSAEGLSLDAPHSSPAQQLVLKVLFSIQKPGLKSKPFKDHD